MLLLTHQPDSLPPGHYVVTLDGNGGVATAVHYSAAPPFQPGDWIRLKPQWEQNVILIDGPLDVAAAVVGKHFHHTIQKPRRHTTIRDLPKR